MKRRRMIYEGKAKILYEGPEPGTLIQYFKDDTTAFDATKKATLDGKGVCSSARVGLGAVAARALLVPAAADALIGTKVDTAALDRLAAAASAACQPIDDKRGTKEFRIKVAGVMARRAAAIATQRARRQG